MKKVLVVEDDRAWSNIIRQKLETKFLVFQAFSIKEAEAVFKRHSDLAVILMDACVPGHEPNTTELIRKIRKTFKGPMISMSGSAEYRDKAVEAGCNYESEKRLVAQKVFELMGIS